MYTPFFGLARKPFSMTPDPAFLFLTRQHREALAGLSYAVLDRKGFLSLTGVAGTGKTTLLSSVLKNLTAPAVQTSVVLNPMLTPDEFLEMAMLDFGIREIPESKTRRLLKLQGFLAESNARGHICALIVDEAHKLSPALLEEIRLLGNFEHEDRKLLQILLIGQSELDEVLNQPGLWQLRQRIAVRLSIEPLSQPEVEEYIQHRWRKAGGERQPFTAAAVELIARYSQGVPRLINSICDSALMLALADSLREVGPEQIETVARDFRLTAARPGEIAGSARPASQAAVTPVPVPAPASAPAVASPQSATIPAVTTAPAPAVIPAPIPAVIPMTSPAGTPLTNQPAAPSAPGGIMPATPIRIKSLERYLPPQSKPSFFARWASWLGFASSES